MSKILRVWKGTGYNKDVSLTEYQYSDGSIHYTFRDRKGMPGNPTPAEAADIIKNWKLVEEV